LEFTFVRNVEYEKVKNGDKYKTQFDNMTKLSDQTIKKSFFIVYYIVFNYEKKHNAFYSRT